MLCRLCVNECGDFTSIFKCEGLKNDIENLISSCFTFQVSRYDERSKIVCQSCFDILQNFNSFRATVESAQEKWKIIYDQDVKDEIHFYEVKEPEDATQIEPIDDDQLDLKAEQNPLSQEHEESHTYRTEIYIPMSPQEEKSKKFKLSQQFDRLIASYSKLFCSECTKPMDSFKNLKRHFKEDHEKVGYMICCKRKFFRAADLADHINIHLNPEFFKCFKCDKCFSSRYSLDFHLKTFHLKGSANHDFKCDSCPRKFLNKLVLEKHKKQHESEANLNNHYCKQCGKGYPSESKLKAHHFNVHTDVYSRMCHLCGKIVRGNKALERHQLQHAGIKPKVQCEICNTELSTKGILKAHMIALHPEDSNETHECNMCGKRAPSKRALKYHMDYVHKCERSHKCNLCDKSFKRLQALQEHITTHTGERLYECPHCPKTFKVRSNMHHHRKLKHPKEFEENRKNRAK